uniref:Bestrophin homolog n=1 Tax=Plectus sambesii TaxID=2011161 RepID=A0A914VYN3_9BILA
MTITYTLDVSTSKVSSFCKLLLRWRGSLWKSVYKELFLWLCGYTALSLVYRLALNPEQRIIFEDISVFAYRYTDFIPLTFILGFFVSLVIDRWWDMFSNIGWIDNAALYVSTYIQGSDDKVRIMRRQIIRFLVLTQAMVFRDISIRVRRRFPTLETVQAAGFMSKVELSILEEVATSKAKYWVPIQWAMLVVHDARRDGLIQSHQAVQDLLQRILEWRSGLSRLSHYDWVPIPLVYTQVVFLTVRCYFLICMMGRQYVNNTDRNLDYSSPIDLYVPVVTMVQFTFYIGWMKVAEALVNPFGEDDDDFEVNWLLDRNLQVGLQIVDNVASEKRPPLEKDFFWEDQYPEPLYSEEAAHTHVHPQVGSATEMPFHIDHDITMVHRVHEEGEDEPPMTPRS